MLLTIHIAASALAIIFGAVALAAKKGGQVHRRSGFLFVVAMLVMALSASFMALRKSPTDGNVVAAFLTIYFVGTGLATVRPPTAWTRRLNIAALVLATSLAVLAFVGGVKNIGNPLLSPGGVPFRTIGAMSFVLFVLLSLAAVGDVRAMRSGPLRGGARLARHLWRMCVALFIAAGSFFSIGPRVAKVLPAPFATGTMRALPILLLFAVMFYWLWRVRRRKPLTVVIRAEAVPHDRAGVTPP